jgi:hypothetical protein
MSRPLTRAVRVVEHRFRLLEQTLNDELGFHDQRLRFAKLQQRRGTITWRLGNQHNDANGIAVPTGTAANFADAANDESILYFGYNEEWQNVGIREQIEFVSSNLRFVIAGVENLPDLRFRLEWAGAKTEGGTVRYPGVGAAHPHWQFDVDSGWIDPIVALAPRADEAAIEIDLEPGVEDIDLAPVAAVPVRPSAPRISATLAGFHHLHLPARAMWHELQCIMPDVAGPQQHTPQSEDEVGRWLISALRYLRHEFELYL